MRALVSISIFCFYVGETSPEFPQINTLFTGSVAEALLSCGKYFTTVCFFFALPCLALSHDQKLGTSKPLKYLNTEDSKAFPPLGILSHDHTDDNVHFVL